MRATFVFSAYVSRALTQLAFLFLFARLDGPVGAGQFAAALAVSAPIFATAELGLRAIYHSSPRRAPFANYLLLRLGGATAAGLSSVGLLLASDLAPPAVGIAVAFQKVGASLLEVFDAYLVAEQRIIQAGLLAWANSGLVLAAVAYTSYAGGSPSFGVLASGAIAIVFACAILIYIRLVTGPLEHPQIAEMRRILQQGWALGLGQALVSVLAYAPILYLSVQGAVEGAGVFATAQYWLTAANLAFVSLQQISLPRLRALAMSSIRHRAQLHKDQAVLLTGGTLMAASILVGLPQANAWLYGPAFETPRRVAVVFALVAVLVAVEYAMLLVHYTRNVYRAQLIYAGVSLTMVGITWPALSSQVDPVLAAAILLLVATSGRSLSSIAIAKLTRNIPVGRHDETA